MSCSSDQTLISTLVLLSHTLYQIDEPINSNFKNILISIFFTFHNLHNSLIQATTWKCNYRKRNTFSSFCYHQQGPKFASTFWNIFKIKYMPSMTMYLKFIMPDVWFWGKHWFWSLSKSFWIWPQHVLMGLKIFYTDFSFACFSPSWTLCQPLLGILNGKVSPLIKLKCTYKCILMCNGH